MVKKVVKPTVVLMAGLPGAGKSTLAQGLGKKLNYPVLERDTFKDLLLNVPKIKEGFPEDEASRTAYEIFFHLAHDLIVNQRKSIVLDSSTLHPFILLRSKELAEQADANLKIILCRVDETTRQKRLYTRPKRISQVHSHLMTEEKATGLKQLPSDIFTIETKEGKKEENIKEAVAYVTNKKQSLYDKFHEKWRSRQEKLNFTIIPAILFTTQMGWLYIQGLYLP